MRTPLTLFALLVLTGCASVTGSKFQPIVVQTVYDDTAVAGAGCTLTNGAGKWTVTTPGSVSVQKSISDMLVECYMAEGLSGQLAVPSKANPANWGNLLLGGPVGLVVDAQTGAGYDYPSVIAVTLNRALEAVVREPTAPTPPTPPTPPEPLVQSDPSAQVAPSAKTAEDLPAKPAVEKPVEAPRSQPNAEKAIPPSPAPAPVPIYVPKRAQSYWE